MTDTSSDGSQHSLQKDIPDEPFPTEALQPPDGSQSKTDRVWKLMLATMRILGKYCTQLITAAERALQGLSQPYFPRSCLGTFPIFQVSIFAPKIAIFSKNVLLKKRH